MCNTGFYWLAQNYSLQCNALPLPHSSTGGTPTHTERTSTLTGVSICFYKKVGYEVVELQAEYQSSTWSTGEGSVLYCWHPGRGGGLVRGMVTLSLACYGRGKWDAHLLCTSRTQTWTFFPALLLHSLPVPQEEV